MRIVLGVVTLLVCGVAHGLETTINVLAVETFYGGYATEITEHMHDLRDNWPNPGGITVTLVNGGFPVILPVVLPTGSGTFQEQAQQQLQFAKDELEKTDLRGIADIVIFFSTSMPICGTSKMTNWTIEGRHAFIPNADGLDLDGADLYYAALMHPAGGCAPETALHEFGHLFSAGHSYTGPNAAPQGSYLLPANHAFWVSIPNWPYGTLSQKTIMAQGGIGGTQLWRFSDGGSTNNRAGLVFTGLSLANYRSGVALETGETDQCRDGVDNDGNGPTDYPNDPGCTAPSDPWEYGVLPPAGCSLTSPLLVTGVLTGICVPSYPYTRHTISWIDVCPSAATHYQVWGNNVFGWNTAVPTNSVLVWGANVTFKIKSCNGPVCSDLSFDSYLAISGC